jgi:hypothetical protein
LYTFHWLIMTNKSLVLKHLTAANDYLADPVPLRGSDIDRFTKQHGLHLSETGFILGINTAGLYTKKNSEKRLPSSLSILLRIFSSFPAYMPKLAPPTAEELVEKIISIDSTFKKSHLGPLMGLETNSTFRLFNEGPDKASLTVRHLMFIIDAIVTDYPHEWPVIREIIETEAASRQVIPPSTVWARGGWTKHIRAERSASDPNSQSTAKPLKRRVEEPKAE